jgi:hypothetical protein
MQILQQLIDGFEPGSGEREYHSTLAKIVAGIQFDDANADLGIGLVRFLTMVRFASGPVDTGTHAVALSWEENAIFVASLFGKLSHPPGWWHFHALSGHQVELEWWREQFKRSPLVSWVSPI